MLGYLCHACQAVTVQWLAVGVMLQLLSSAEHARMRTRFAQMSGEEKQGGWECVPAPYSPAVRLISESPKTVGLGELGRGQGGTVL